MFLKVGRILRLAKEDDSFLNVLLQSEEAIKFVKHAIKVYTKSPAKFMAVNKVEWDDLLQAAFIGLFQAIRNLNLELSPNEWVRYTYLTIQGELRKFSRSNDSNMLVITQRIRELYPKYKKFHEEFWISNGKDPTIEDTMRYFHISRDDAFELVYGMQEIISVEGDAAAIPSARNNKVGFQNQALAKSGVQFQCVEMEAINNIMVETAMKYVNDIQRKIIYLHYFKGLTKTEISRLVGCSNSMVSKYMSTAFQRIRKGDAFVLN